MDPAAITGGDGDGEAERLARVAGDNTLQFTPGAFRGGNLVHVDIAAFPVTTLPDNTFSGCLRLRVVVLPNTVTDIGMSCFSDCPRLQYVNLHSLDLVTAVRAETFSRTPSLGEYRGEHALCAELKRSRLYNKTWGVLGKNKLRDPSAILAAGERGLVGVGLAAATAARVVAAARNAPTGLAALVGDTPAPFALPPSVEIVGRNAFLRSGIQALDARGTRVRVIGECAFKGCKNLETVALPPTVCLVNPMAFCSCTALAAVDMGACAHVTKILHSTFSDARNLRQVTLPPNLATIYERAFFNTHALTSVRLPGSTAAVLSKAFMCDRFGPLRRPGAAAELWPARYILCGGDAPAVHPSALSNSGMVVVARGNIARAGHLVPVPVARALAVPRRNARLFINNLMARLGARKHRGRLPALPAELWALIFDHAAGCPGTPARARVLFPPLAKKPDVRAWIGMLDGGGGGAVHEIPELMKFLYKGVTCRYKMVFLAYNARVAFGAEHNTTITTLARRVYEALAGRDVHTTWENTHDRGENSRVVAQLRRVLGLRDFLDEGTRDMCRAVVAAQTKQVPLPAHIPAPHLPTNWVKKLRDELADDRERSVCTGAL